LREETREEGTLKEGAVWSVGCIFGECDEERRDGGTEGERIEGDFENIVE
jgi:hypothetical protein